MLDGVGVVGAWTLHELVKVVRLALLGLLAYSVSHSDQSWVGRSIPVLLILLALLCGGALALVLMLDLAPVPTTAEDRPDLVVHGDVKQVTGGMGLHIAELVDQGLAGCPREECTNDVCVDDIRERVASLGEPVDVIPQGLTGLLLAALEVLGVS